MCWCKEDIPSEPFCLRLRCNCVVHRSCLIGLLKSWTRDINRVQEWGLPCPFLDDCEFKRKHGRVCHITPSDMSFLITCEENGELPASSVVDDGIGYSLNTDDVERLSVLQLQKRVHLSCGCAISYEMMVQVLRQALDHAISLTDIKCPNNRSGHCPGKSYMSINRKEVSALINTGLEYQKRGLLPIYVDQPKPHHLEAADLARFHFAFHHVELGCGCSVHYAVLLKYLLETLRSFHAVCGDPVDESSSSDLATVAQREEKQPQKVDVGEVALQCPHGEHCEHFVATGRKYGMVEEDIDAVRAFEVGDNPSQNARIADVSYVEKLLDALIDRCLFSESFVEAIQQGSLYGAMLISLLDGEPDQLDVFGVCEHLHISRQLLKREIRTKDRRFMVQWTASADHSEVTVSTDHSKSAENDTAGASLDPMALQKSDDLPVPLAPRISTSVSNGLFNSAGQNISTSNFVAIVGNNSAASPRKLSNADFVRLKKLCGSSATPSTATGDAVAVADPISATLALRDATSKKCPSCGFPQTHYHGHYCHHVREGCYRCKVHFCYRCLCTAEENLRDRGYEGNCECGGWGASCEQDDLLQHLVEIPYPHDR